ncbi:MAG: hypothetical protein M1825_001774 [Sarcosagium campestre]|nr:MAG: hypothetical protein M1825_001774 [Sarcosagium campestre]
MICSEEEAYAGPMLRVGGNPQSGPQDGETIPPTERARYYRGSSEKFSFTRDGVYTNEQFRVGGPDLCLLPAEHANIDKDPQAKRLEKATDSLQEVVHAVLKRHNLRRPEGPIIAQRYWKYDREPDHRFTVLMWLGTREKVNDDWLLAVKEIRRLYADNGFSDIIVEMFVWRDPVLSFPVGAAEDITRIWPSLEPQIVKALSGKECLELNVLRRGREKVPNDNPVTVVLTVSPTSTDDWIAIREWIVHLLNNNGLEYVAVEIGAGVLWPFGGVPSENPLPNDAWKGPAKMGCSIGPLGSTETSATLGGYLQLQHPNGQWSAFGVTCHHAAVPEFPTEYLSINPTTLADWHKSGIKPNAKGCEMIKIASPSLDDHETAISYFEAQIRAAKEDPAYQEVEQLIADEEFIIPHRLRVHNVRKEIVDINKNQLKAAKALFERERNYLGRLFASSGCRQSSNLTSLDWALLKISAHRVSENELPNPESFFGLNFIPIFSPLEPNVTTVANIQETLDSQYPHVFKSGRSSGLTQGILNGIKSHTFDQWGYRAADGQNVEVIRRDMVVTSNALRGAMAFAIPGDSGAFVYNRLGHFIGMAIGGNSHSNTTSVTCARDLFDDIKKITGARAVRLAE